LTKVWTSVRQKFELSKYLIIVGFKLKINLIRVSTHPAHLEFLPSHKLPILEAYEGSNADF